VQVLRAARPVPTAAPRCPLQEIAPFLRVLGTYPMDTELGFTSSDDLQHAHGGTAATP